MPAAAKATPESDTVMWRKTTRALRARAEQVEQALTPEQLTGLLRDVEVILREENQDWRTVIRLHELEPP